LSYIFFDSYIAKELSTFEAVCSQMLEDVQERLVYRTQVYIRNEILSYKPSPGDIAYPEKLEMMQVNIRTKTNEFARIFSF
jgi:hypothetical protein